MPIIKIYDKINNTNYGILSDNITFAFKDADDNSLEIYFNSEANDSLLLKEEKTQEEFITQFSPFAIVLNYTDGDIMYINPQRVTFYKELPFKQELFIYFSTEENDGIELLKDQIEAQKEFLTKFLGK
jgi:hypothetical protein